MPGRGDVNYIRVFWIDDDARYSLGVFEPHEFPRVARVGALVHAGAHGHAVASPRLAGADPYRIGMRLIDGYRADRLRVLVEDRLEGRTGVDGLPHAAAGASYI